MAINSLAYVSSAACIIPICLCVAANHISRKWQCIPAIYNSMSKLMNAKVYPGTLEVYGTHLLALNSFSEAKIKAISIGSFTKVELAGCRIS